VIADFKLSLGFDVLICHATITHELVIHFQFHCPQAEAKFVIVAEIPFDPRQLATGSYVPAQVSTRVAFSDTSPTRLNL